MRPTTEAAEPPADHRWVPSLTAVEIGEALHHLNCDRATRREGAMSCPQAHSPGSDCPDALHDEIQRLIPTDAAPSTRSAIITNFGVHQSSRVAKDLAGAAAAHAKETLTIRIVLVTADRLQLAAFHFDQHSAKRWVAIHGTHSPDDFRITSGHVHLRPRHRARVILSEMATRARVRFGSNASLWPSADYFRSSPGNGHRQGRSACLRMGWTGRAPAPNRSENELGL